MPLANFSKLSKKLNLNLDNVDDVDDKIFLACFSLYLTSCRTCSNWRHLWGWSGVAKVLCILSHRGVQIWNWLIVGQDLLSFVAGKDRGGWGHVFSCLTVWFCFTWILFLDSRLITSMSQLTFIFSTISSYLFSPFLWEMTQNDPQGLPCSKTPTQSKTEDIFSVPKGW